ncbi:MAG TPA: hypothetical protein VMP68_29390 [Candidatus Eisenbacteria bacterium]|nr:hypothetical protein [Candidatus Eisenbacteria bacterium]
MRVHLTKLFTTQVGEMADGIDIVPGGSLDSAVVAEIRPTQIGGTASPDSPEERHLTLGAELCRRVTA